MAASRIGSSTSFSQYRQSASPVEIKSGPANRCNPVQEKQKKRGVHEIAGEST
jgi:hypothetical protein